MAALNNAWSGESFTEKKFKARTAGNPKTNTEVQVPARKKAVFKVSRELNKLLK
ncbi:HU family DNA-binding protein [Gemmatimonadota bacterium]